jgi:hypothetical protein
MLPRCETPQVAHTAYLCAETRAASARGAGVWIGEDKSAAHDLILKVDRGAVEVQEALWIAHHPHREGAGFCNRRRRATITAFNATDGLAIIRGAVGELSQFIGVLLHFGQIKDVTKATASTALDANAETNLVCIEALLMDDVADFAGC